MKLSDTVLFAKLELFWFELKEYFMFPFYHPDWPDDNERMERYWPCSGKPQFWPSIVLDDP